MARTPPRDTNPFVTRTMKEAIRLADRHLMVRVKHGFRAPGTKRVNLDTFKALQRRGLADMDRTPRGSVYMRVNNVARAAAGIPIDVPFLQSTAERKLAEACKRWRYRERGAHAQREREET